MKTNIETVPWITQKSQIKKASIESLKRALLTSDGAGKEIKEECLRELVTRAIDNTVYRIVI